MKGPFITLEGIDGNGKTTQAELLAQHLRSLRYDVLHTREPGGTETARSIAPIILDRAHRALSPIAELFLYMADRAQHVEEVIRPHLTRGGIVLCERFSDSTLAYQGYGRGLDLEIISQLNRIATGGLRPEITILIDLPVEEAIRRKERAAGMLDRLELEGPEFHAKVRAGYLKLAARYPDRFAVLDGSQDMKTLFQEIVAAIVPKLTKHFHQP